MVVERKRGDVAGVLRKLEGRRWTAADAEALIAAWRESGLPARAFAAKHGFDHQRLHWWANRLGESKRSRKKRTTRPRSRLVRAKLVGAPVPAIGAAVLVRVGVDVVLEVDAAVVSPEWLASLLERLSRR